MSDYIIESAGRACELQGLVNQKIKAGYKPIGGVCISPDDPICGSVYYQAMVKIQKPYEGKEL